MVHNKKNNRPINLCFSVKRKRRKPPLNLPLTEPDLQTDAEREALLAKAAEHMPGAGKGREFSRKVDDVLARVKDLDLKRERGTVSRKPANKSTGDKTVSDKTDQNSETIFNQPTPGVENGGKTVANMLGEITWLMSQSPNHKNFFISDLEWMVMTPILLKQFRVFYAKDRPIGCMMWAHANEEVASRLAAGNARLKPQDWKSGEELWVVDIIAPYGGQDEMLKDLKGQVFADRKVKFLSLVEGKMVVKEV